LLSGIAFHSNTNLTSCVRTMRKSVTCRSIHRLPKTMPMKGIISILHISDLHRSPENKITNSALLSSLVTDNDKYTSEEPRLIKSPDLIIVSGDLIRGSVKETGSEKEVEDQYREAEEFLDMLCKQFLDNDRSRLVIIPGNHDIDWKYSKASMHKMETSKVFNNGNLVNAQILKMQ
jgi:predicted MPP superfamily phosphohydrolase